MISLVVISDSLVSHSIVKLNLKAEKTVLLKIMG